MRRTLVAGLAMTTVVAIALSPAASAISGVPTAGRVVADDSSQLGRSAGSDSAPVSDLAARLKKAKDDRDNPTTESERRVAAQKSGIKAPSISRTSLDEFRATQAALQGKNRSKVGGVTPHYFGPFANYTNSPQHMSAAIVDFAAPAVGGRAAAGTAVVNDAGVITDVTITDSGQYAIGETPAVTFSALPNTDGASATGLALMSNVVTGVGFGDGGVGYNDPVSVTFTGGGIPDAPGVDTHQATAVATIDLDGTITGITITDPGLGYTSAPTVTVTDDVLQYTEPVGGFTVEFGTGVVGVDVTNGGSGYMLPGIRKFQDDLPTPQMVNDPNKVKTNLGGYLPVAVADTTSFPGSDFYEIGIVQYRDKLHSDLPATLMRGYVQLAPNNPDGTCPANAVQLANAQLNPAAPDEPIVLPNGAKTGLGVAIPNGSPACAYDTPHMLGPIMAAAKDRPVRVLFRNLLPTGVKGDLFLPVDTTVMGSGVTDAVTPDAANNYGMGADPQNPQCGESPKPAGKCYTENRASIHMHGGATPWISDGTPHQWFTPATENTNYPQGVSVKNVPDMADPGAGAMTFFYSNQQSARLMFYHDHAWGITRLNVYAGEAAGYLITDASESLLQTNGVIPAANATLPLIVQDRTFVPTTAELSVSDPTWDTAAWGTKGNLWVPHVYMPAQNPWDPSGTNQFGRWAYGPWFWPPTNQITFGPKTNPYAGQCIAGWCEPAAWKEIPGTPNESMGMEAFNDTPMVNGVAYPKVTLQPKAYRFKILNAANDRFFNLQLYKATGTAPGAGVNGTNCIMATGENCSEVALNPAEVAAAQTDPIVFPTPDLTQSPAGPVWNMLGTESGWIAQPTQIPNQVTTWVTDPTVFNAGNVDKHSLLLGPAQRADVVVDFSKYAGQTLILYNDAPAAFPARDPRYDYYTGGPDMRDTGGAAPTPAGYGPNTRTVMRITIAGPVTGGGGTFSLTKANKWWASTKLGGQGIFEKYQPPIVVGQAAYNRAYGTAFGTDTSYKPNDGFVRITDDTFTFNTLTNNGTTPGATGSAKITMTMWAPDPTNPDPALNDFKSKAMHDEMGAAWDNMYGRMSGNLGLEAPNKQAGLAQNLVLYPFVNPSTENFDGFYVQPGTFPQDEVIPIVTLHDGTQIWKITHNGVDTHPIHFHFSDVQLVNRVGWDGIIRAPEASEVGWQDTVRVSPLEDTIVAMRPILPKTPFGVPTSSRQYNPALPIGSTDGFNSTDYNGNAITPPYQNDVVSFDWEYVWHCHILSHEEMDMMRPITVKAPATKPDASLLALAVSGGDNVLTWNDPTNPANASTWGNAKNEVGYRVMRAPIAGGVIGAYTKRADVLANATTYTDAGAAAGNYSYKLESYNAAGSTASNEVGAPMAPSAPGIVSAVANLKTITLTWTAPYNGGSAITKYVIQRQSGANWTTVDSNVPAGSLSYQVTGLAASTTYTYRIQAVNAIGSGAYGTFASVTTASVPPRPASVTMTQGAVGSRAITVNWPALTDPAGAPITGYTITWGTTNTGTGVGTKTIAGTSATVSNVVTGLTNGQVLYFRVLATNGMGNGTARVSAATVTVR